MTTNMCLWKKASLWKYSFQYALKTGHLSWPKLTSQWQKGSHNHCWNIDCNINLNTYRIPEVVWYALECPRESEPFDWRWWISDEQYFFQVFEHRIESDIHCMQIYLSILEDWNWRYSFQMNAGCEKIMKLQPRAAIYSFRRMSEIFIFQCMLMISFSGEWEWQKPTHGLPGQAARSKGTGRWNKQPVILFWWWGGGRGVR